MADQSIRRHLLAGATVVFFLVGGVGGWAATARFSGAVIVPAQLVVESHDKKVQHPTGGVVAELKVREGSHVKAGDILIRLDDTQARASLAIVTKSLDELIARQARDEAEQNDADTIAFPKEFLARMGDPQVAHIVSGERKLFHIRHFARAGEKGQLIERIAQTKEEIKGLAVEIGAKDRQVEWIQKELNGVNVLWKKKLVPYSRVSALERERARLIGDRGQLQATIAQSRGKIGELELQIIQIDQNLHAEVGKDLAEIRAKEAELREKKIAAEDQVKRIDIKAPQTGIVHQLNVHTVGGVIGSGETIMLIVPEFDALIVEGKLQPRDIDQVRPGQDALLLFSAFSQRTTPQLNGVVSGISADVTQDQKSGEPFYTVRISVSKSETARLGTVNLVAGMPVEAFIQTRKRSVMSYLVKPLADQIKRAFREQ